MDTTLTIATCCQARKNNGLFFSVDYMTDNREEAEKKQSDTINNDNVTNPVCTQSTGHKHVGRLPNE